VAVPERVLLGYADTPTRQHADTPIRRYADTPIRRYADTPIRFFPSPTLKRSGPSRD
jgi:hypothetical protein